MISLIIPTYSQTDYLLLLLKSIYREPQNYPFEVIVVFDNPKNTRNEEVIDLYKEHNNFRYISFKENKGFAHALNVGVQSSKYESVLLLNDDNVLPKFWANYLSKYIYSLNTTVYSINQIEPTPSMFMEFWISNFGINPEQFDFESFDRFCEEKSESSIRYNSWTFPILMGKYTYLSVNGLDVTYPGNHVSDLDLFTKLTLNKYQLNRIMDTPVYHFGSSTFKQPDMAFEKMNTEALAHAYYKFKWGYPVEFNKYKNSFFPTQLNHLLL